jgi:hypothetical protein
MGPNCPIFGNNGNNNNRQGRWVFQLLAGDASESGNAPDAQAAMIRQDSEWCVCF